MWPLPTIQWFNSSLPTSYTINRLHKMSEANSKALEELLKAQPFKSAEDALDSVLKCLKLHVPYKLWMVTRLDDNDWTVVRSLDEGYGARPGSTFDWTGTYCSHMVNGEGPMFAEDAQQHAVYRLASINQQLNLPIGAYIGLPLLKLDGELSGTLCALDPVAQLPLNEHQKTLVLTLTRSLSTLQVVYAMAEQARRKAETHQYEAETDALTGVCNRRGWDLALRDQELATTRTTQNAMVAVIDLDDLKVINDTHGHGAGDALLKKAAQTIKGQFREEDVIARLGGDEFAALVPGISSSSAIRLVERLRSALAEAGVAASVGYALRLQHTSIEQTVHEADRAMYRHKNERK